MKRSWSFAALWLAAWLLLPAVGLGDKLSDVVNASGVRDKQLQASFLQFPYLMPDEFRKFELKNPVTIDGIDFYGFKFTVPKRTNQEDLVWACILPNEFCDWYIVPKTGSMAGFTEYFHESRAAYLDLDGLFPTKGNELVIQRLAGDSLEDGNDYLIWFAFRYHQPRWMSVKFTFAGVPEQSAHHRKVLEKVLGLRRAPPNPGPPPLVNK
jgi:hypothetical protein